MLIGLFFSHFQPRLIDTNETTLLTNISKDSFFLAHIKRSYFLVKFFEIIYRLMYGKVISRLMFVRFY